MGMCGGLRLGDGVVYVTGGLGVWVVIVGLVVRCCCDVEGVGMG